MKEMKNDIVKWYNLSGSWMWVTTLYQIKLQLYTRLGRFISWREIAKEIDWWPVTEAIFLETEEIKKQNKCHIDKLWL